MRARVHAPRERVSARACSDVHTRHPCTRIHTPCPCASSHVHVHGACASKGSAIELEDGGAATTIFDKVGGSLEDVQSATSLDWSSKRLTDDDCKLIADLVASGSLAQLTVSSHPTKAFPAHRALVCALC